MERLVIISLFILCAFCMPSANATSITPECYRDGLSHPEIDDCQENILKEKYNSVNAAYIKMRKLIPNIDADTGDIDETDYYFEKSIKSFDKYAVDQCDLILSLSNGGNGGHNMAYECLIDLYGRRLIQLKEISEVLKKEPRDILLQGSYSPNPKRFNSNDSEPAQQILNDLKNDHLGDYK